ncbi:phage tail tape measure protein [Bacillus sp. JJ1562]|uniref:phage tail tape measure protein n=1 Tax=Bacillus sp. JJ1562 TaxID=3122960 RepID=UPI003001F47F
MKAGVKTEIRAKLSLNSSEFKKGMQDARNELDKSTKKSKDLKAEMTGIQTASLAVAGAIVSGVGVAVKVAADFEAQLSRVAGISGANADEMARLKDTALELGAATSKSAGEIAIAMEDLAAKGFDANKIIGAMPGIVAAAEASGSDLALTANVITSALNAFQMEATEATKVADILATTANISAANMLDMSYALKYAAPIAHTLGISMEELAASVGIMVDNGLAGEQAGTTLRMALQRLADPTKEGAAALEALGVKTTDASGNFLDLSDIIPQFVKGLNNMTDAQKVARLSTIFGTEAASGMLSVISQGPEKFNEFVKGLENSAGASEATAKIMKDNLKGSFEEFTGALETLGIKIGDEFLDEFRKIIDVGTDVADSLADLNPKIFETGAKAVGAAAGLALAASSIVKIVGALKLLSLSPVGMVITGLSVLTGIVIAAKEHYDNLNTVSLDNAKAMIEQKDQLTGLITDYDTLSAKSRLTTDEMARFVDINSELNKTADPQIIARLTEEQNLLLEKSGLTNEEMQKFVDVNGQLVEVVPDANVVISEQGNILLKNTDAAKKLNKEQLENIRLNLEAEKAKAEASYLDNLEKERKLLEDINTITGNVAEIDGKIGEQQKKLVEEQGKLNAAKESGNKISEFWWNQQIGLREIEIQKLKEEKALEYDALLKKKEKLELTQKDIKALDQVKYQMMQLELSQVGINAKKGEELRMVDNEIAKLKAKKSSMEANTAEAFKNTQEYQDAIRAIDGQLGKLGEVRGRIDAIIKDAGVMNRELGRSISKSVTVYTKGGANLSQYHTGGIVGKQPLNQMPKLHSGGLASRFIDAPKFNEVDVRLLRNEAVLTEAQQANLMRMIDAGQVQSPSSVGAASNEQLERLISAIKSQQIRVTTELDGQTVADATYEWINRKFSQEFNNESQIQGFKF